MTPTMKANQKPLAVAFLVYFPIFREIYLDLAFFIFFLQKLLSKPTNSERRTIKTKKKNKWIRMIKISIFEKKKSNSKYITLTKMLLKLVPIDRQSRVKIIIIN